jgi:hypothetical protein
VFLDALPMNLSGKLDRKALPRPDRTTEVAENVVAPRSPLETTISEVWCAVLGRDRISVHDDFFELGGHSLLAMRIVARLAAALPVRLTIGSIFAERTISGLSELVVRLLAEQDQVGGDEMEDLLAELETLDDAAVERLLEGGGP